MAVPTQPTIENLCTEAYKKCGIASPDSDQLTRAEDYFLEEIKNDIWHRAGEFGNQRLKSLQSWTVQITTDGLSKYDFLSDFDEEITLTWLTGTHTGTAQDGGNTSITLEDAEDATADETVGKYVLLTGGTGVCTPGTQIGFRQITAYDTDTYIATVPTWTTNPDSTSTYRLINEGIDLEEDNVLDVGGLGTMSITEGTPSRFTKIHEDGVTSYILNKNPDASTYGILIRYYANLLLLDTGGTVHDILLYNWRNVLTTGMAFKVAEDEDDNKYLAFKNDYEKGVIALLDREMAFGGEFTGFTL